MKEQTSALVAQQMKSREEHISKTSQLAKKETRDRDAVKYRPTRVRAGKKASKMDKEDATFVTLQQLSALEQEEETEVRDDCS